MKKIRILLLSLILILGLCSAAYGATIEYTGSDGKIIKLSDFKDTKGHWAHDVILKSADYGWVAGDNGNFMPNKPITRADFCVILDRFLGLKNSTYNYFYDLPNGTYYTDAVLKCVAAGYVTGTSTTTVDPTGYATREQIAVIISRMLNLNVDGTSYARAFSDDYQIGSWAKDSVYAMRRNGYMNGDGNNCFNPKSNITRAEVVQVLSNIAGYYFNGKESSINGNFAHNVTIYKSTMNINNSFVAKDIITTFNSTRLEVSNTVVDGKILVLNKCNLSLSDSEINQIILVNGKSNVFGVRKNVSEIYISENATESTLDAIPNLLYLEPGVRVKIDGTMYENETTELKKYLGVELKAAVASDQNFVVGGARIDGTKMEQDVYNNITVSNVTVHKGDSDIVEYGVLWVDENESKDSINPNYQNCKNEKTYKPQKTDEKISFTVGKVSGYQGFRFYVKDKEGLFAYSKTFLFKEYDYSIDTKVYNKDYPRTVQVEIVFTGENIPSISQIETIYALDETYVDKPTTKAMTKYVSPNIGEKIDDTKYIRFSTIISNLERKGSNGQKEYIPYTAYGYRVYFKSGGLITNFPALTQVVPEGTPPITNLGLGLVSFDDNRIILKNNTLSTRYVPVNEVGIAYCESDKAEIKTPSNNFNEWVFASGGKNIDVGQNYSFNSSIPVSFDTKYTYIVPYVKTVNGYYYGTISKIENNWKGDEGGPTIKDGINIIGLSDNVCVVEIPYSSSDNLDTFAPFIISAMKNGENAIELVGNAIADLDCLYYVNSDKLYICLSNLNKDSLYEIMIRLTDINGLKSDIKVLHINTQNYFTITPYDKRTNSSGWTTYSLKGSNSGFTMKDSSCSISESIGKLSFNPNDCTISILGSNDYSNAVVTLNLKYTIKLGAYITKTYDYSRTVKLY